MSRFGSVQVRVERHGRRQYRQRLADRRSRAGADRARRRGSNCAEARTSRELPLEAFFLGYGKQDRRPSEYVRARVSPRACKPHQLYRAFKVSKRFDEDISAVMGAFRLRTRRPPDHRRPRRLWRHGGDAEARQRLRKPRWSASISTSPSTWDNGGRCDRRRLSAAQRHARLRRLSLHGRRQPRQARADRNLRRRDADAPRRPPCR